MSTLVPVHAAHKIREGITEYLTTSFSLADKNTAARLAEFLTDSETGMYRGPYVRTRLPYAPSKEKTTSWKVLPKDFKPYRHQAECFKRLRSIDENGAYKQPEPTLVVTGTGSGKTESFLFPILEHCQNSDARGVKALILYPMNALANDQEKRLAELLDGNPELKNVRAGIYVGETSGQFQKASKDHLITDRTTLQMDPPDILLTNYKMLDQLLLRAADQPIWERSGATLQYLVLDEFHTYDGAQGTDVSLLLRRLELMLKKHRPEGVNHPITPVATSATMGDETNPGAIRTFAQTVFGVEFPEDSIVKETSLNLEQWQDLIQEEFGSWTKPYPELTVSLIKEINEEIAKKQEDESNPYDQDVHEVLCAKLFGCGDSIKNAISAYSKHPLVVDILASASSKVVPLVARTESSEKALAETVLDATLLRQLGDAASEFLMHVLTEISYLRAEYGREFKFEAKQLPGVETHLWVREVSRIERAVGSSSGPMFRWYDDGPSEETQWLPACYCRNCGRSGWMIAKEPGGDQLVIESQKIRATSMENAHLQRPLLDATAEVVEQVDRDRDDISCVHWLNLSTPSLGRKQPGEQEMEEDSVVPVLSYASSDNKDGELARVRTCPSCGEADSMRYLGSSVATLLSVALSNFFGQKDLDDDEKKTLIFTDSVQDAAHRAGFVQSRARAFALRTFIRKMIGDSIVTLDQLPRLLIKAAENSPRMRYELIPSEMVNYDAFRAYWDPELKKSSKRREAARKVAHRLAFDVALEFGQRADLARSLTTTGSLTVGVDVDDEALLSAAQQALRDVPNQLTIDGFSDEKLIAWARGTLEMVRLKGGINHPWFQSYLKHDCNPYMLNNRNSLSKGVTGFARGTTPKFPRKGKALSKKDFGEMPLSSPQGFYARWTNKLLGLSSHDSAKIVSALFDELRSRDIVASIRSETNAELFALEPQTIMVQAEPHPYFLECSVCHYRLSVDPNGRKALNQQPCHNQGCLGQYELVAIDNNYYRALYSSTEPRTVVAREHTSLLPTDERLEVETNFKRPVGEVPHAPNVLVATPTLEMGIDIGDLSSVMLASLPKSVANYIQRVGRAGRLTGNSLVISMIRGRTAALPLLNAPLNMIDGSVEPPAAYLGAEEILKRQLIAYLIEHNELPQKVPQLRWGNSVFSSEFDSQTLMDVIREETDLETHPEIIGTALAEFSSSIKDYVAEDVLTELQQWAKNGGLHSLLDQAEKDWNKDLRLLKARQKEIAKVYQELEKAAESVTADEETKLQKRSAAASLRHLNKQINTIKEEYWISAMERYGLLPNFTLLDDAVDLNVTVSSLNPNTREFDTQDSAYSRGISAALFELAPGATFYIQGIAAKIDTVEIGEKGSAIEQRRFCPSCSYSELVSEEDPKSISCPKCGDPKYADVSQVLNVVQMRRVSAQVERTRSSITDRSEDRIITRFARHTSFRYEPEDVGKVWYLQSGFGVTQLRRVELNFFNLGKGHGEKRALAGNEIEVPLFRVCRSCGHIDSEAGANHWRDHRPWCPLVKAPQEDTVAFALARTLKTQGVLISLPQLLSVADRITVPSVTAALFLGFKLLLGGNPHHLDIHEVSVDGQKFGLLLNDSVPGGTGYLSQFANPAQVRKLLYLAWERLSNCTCANTDRLACENCLLPFAGYNASSISRAAAESALFKILLDDMHPEDDTDPREKVWDLTEEEPQIEKESELEALFLKEFLEQLKTKTEILRSKVQGRKRVWEFRFHNSPNVWRMREQQNMKYTVPDFFIDTDNPSLRNIAVFLDGANYHILGKNNRVAGDMRKRRSLRNQEDIASWSITWKDILDFQKQKEGKPVEPPSWFNEKLSGRLTKHHGVNVTDINKLRRDSVSQLIDFLQYPDRELRTKLADIASFMAVSHDPVKEDGQLKSTHLGDTTMWFDPRGQHRLELAVENEVDETAWRKFLQLSNILFASDNECNIMVREDSYVETRVEEVAESKPVAVSAGGAWGEILAEFTGEDEVVACLEALMARGISLPSTYGEEIDGVPTVAVWEKAHVALLYPEDSQAQEELTSSGWTAIITSGANTFEQELLETLGKD